MVLPILTGASPWSKEMDSQTNDLPANPISAKAVEARRRLNEGINQNDQSKQASVNKEEEVVPEYLPMDGEDDMAGVSPTDVEAESNNFNVNTEAFVNHPSGDIFSQFAGAPIDESQSVPVKSENSLLINKLDHLISILEGQECHKTNNETEEIILYLFLGVFIIYVIDSFGKVAKYTR